MPDNDSEIKRANQSFYRAFEALVLERMDAVWAHDGLVSCVHPGWPLVEGWQAVRESWRTIFRNTGRIRFRATDERVDVRGDLAWVVCIERLSQDATSDEATVLATNIFRREEERWLLVHHHGSPYAEPEAPRPAARKAPRGSLN